MYHVNESESELFIPVAGAWLQVWGGLAEAKRDRIFWADYYGICPEQIDVIHNGRSPSGYNL